MAPAIAEVNPPVPVYVKPVAVAIDSTISDAIVLFNMILLVPNVITLVFEFVELNIPVVKLKPFSANVPEVNVNVVAVAVAAVPYVPVKVTVPAALLIMMEPALLPLPLTVCVVPVRLATKLVYVPALPSTKLFGVTFPTTSVGVLPVKFNVLKKLVAVKDGTAVPEVIDRFGALDEVPLLLVEPKAKVADTTIGEVNPPVPVQVKPVAICIASTVLPATV